jgi:hypothetical protein
MASHTFFGSNGRPIFALKSLIVSSSPSQGGSITLPSVALVPDLQPGMDMRFQTRVIWLLARTVLLDLSEKIQEKLFPLH